MGPTILLFILICVLLAALPVWPYSRNWGPLPAGLVGLIVVVLLIFLMLDKFRF